MDTKANTGTKLVPGFSLVSLVSFVFFVVP